MPTSASPELENRPTSHLPTKVFKGHTDTVSSVAYFKDGKRIISGSWDKTIRIWNVESGKQEGRSLEHDFVVECISISPDERTLAVSGQSTGGDWRRRPHGKIVLWDLESRKTVRKIQKKVDGDRMAFSPGGQLIAVTAGKGIVLLNAETGERIREPLQFGENIHCLAFSPDGARIATGTKNGNVRVSNVATGETVIGPINAHTDSVTSMVFTPDGKQIITSSSDKSIRVWNGSTGQAVGNPMLGHEQGIYHIALSRDGRCLASTQPGKVRIWSVSARREIQAQDECVAVALSVAWSPDGQSVVAGGGEGSIYLWDVLPLEDLDTTTTPPVLVAGSPPLPSTSQFRSSSLSPSLLDLPAGVSPPKQPNSNPPPLPDDFWDSSNLDLPALAHPPISSVHPAERLAADISSPASTKTTPNAAVSQLPPKAPINIFARILARLRRHAQAVDEMEMQPPQSHLPKYSPVVKVPLAEADARLYTPGPKKKPEEIDEDDVSEESFRDDGCLNAICFCEYLKWLKYRRELRRQERRRRDRQNRRLQEQEAHEHQSQPSLIAEGANQAGSTST
ncbi:quinon protein alcohol dehydrogenase-like superfamily [Hygrophoropsis aurantiaca]|uniref:Quinon protein alcohol dehydrogenase-like superfamily n=1 Tax=Hygrophoropsis aurantiaca TaxID=72124 RepID=A0ACB8A0P2_9AGAM|nr:quinon protein alcohol dehydrogenase-like superfamily [Hygrophoropsis aurantiaca]